MCHNTQAGDKGLMQRQVGLLKEKADAVLCREIRDRAGVEEIRIRGALEHLRGSNKQGNRRRETGKVQGSER